MCGWLIHPLSYESKGAKSRYHAEQQVEKGGYTQIGDVFSNRGCNLQILIKWKVGFNYLCWNYTTKF